MVSVDRVYQKVLAIANKEQRGYITPQEFNLFADQAQIEIFEQYFYDLNQFQRIHGNNTGYADVDNILEEKLQIFESTDNTPIVNGYVNAGTNGNKILPGYIYRVSRIVFNQRDCEILRTKDFHLARHGGPLCKPSNTRPIANIRSTTGGRIMRVVSGDGIVTPSHVVYFRRPTRPNWTYIVTANTQTALYNPSASDARDFELHPSEESELVYRVLSLAGVTLQKPELTQVAASLEGAKVQQEKR